MESTQPAPRCFCCGGPHLPGNCETYSYCDLCGKDLVYCSCEPEMTLIVGSYPWLAQPKILEEPDVMVTIDESYPWLAQPKILEEPDVMVTINESYPWLAEDWVAYEQPLEQNSEQEEHALIIEESWEEEQNDGGTSVFKESWQSSPLEDALIQFMQMTKTMFQSQEQFMKTMEKNHEASMKNLETQIGQLSKQLAELSSSGLPATTVDNPRNETAKAVPVENGEKKVSADSEKNELSGKDGEVENELSEKTEEEKKIEREDHIVGRETQGAQCWEGVKIQQEITQQIIFPTHLSSNKEDRSEELDRYLDSFYALFVILHLERVWKHLQLYLKFMKFLPNKRKKKDDVFFVSYIPP